MPAKNALTYLRNVGKSLGYSAVDTFKEYNPGMAAIAKSASELGSELYESVKSFKSDFSADRNEKSFIGTARSFVGEMKTNLLEDLQTGNWYNKARIDKNENEMFGLMFGMDGDDPFGDFDFDFDDDLDLDDGSDDGMSTDTQTIVSTQKESTNAIIQALDAAGSKGAMAISTATVRSADYVVTAQRESSKALYNMHMKGYNQLSTGLAAINANISSLLALGEPITTHIQNSATFYTKSTEYQQKTIELLEKIVENTKTEETNSTSKNITSMDDLITDGVLDFGRYFDYLKEKATSTVKEVNSMTEMFGGVDGLKKLATGSPAKFISDNIIKNLIPNDLKKEMESFNSTFQNFFLAGMNKLQKKDFSGAGFLGQLFEGAKDILFPREQYKSNPGLSNYQKGKIAWDGVAKKALTEVIPTQLAHIEAALTGGPVMIYDYDRARFVKHGELQERFNDEKMGYARRAGGDFRDDLRQSIRSSGANDVRKEQLYGMIDQFFLKSFERGSGFYDVMKESFNGKDYGLDDESLNLIRMMITGYNKNNKRGRALEYAGEMRAQRDSYGSYMNRLGEDSLNPYLQLFNGQEGFGNRKVSGGIIGLDDYNHDIFFYLQGIYQYTGHLSDNIGLIGTGSGRYARRKDLKKGGSIAPVRQLTKFLTEEQQAKIVEQIKAKTLAEEGSDYSFTDDDILRVLDPNFKRIKEKEKKYDKDGNLIEESSAEKLSSIIDEWVDKGKRKKTEKEEGGILGTIRDFFNVPTKIATDILESGERSMYRLIYGREAEDEDEPGLFGYFFQKADELFDKFDKHQEDKQKKTLKEYMDDLKTKLFGAKNEDGQYEGGKLSQFVNSVRENLDAAGEWALGDVYRAYGIRKKKKLQNNGVGETEEINVNAPSARGRKVTRTGIVAVSEGELIIPSEFNPFYHGKTDKRRQIRDEHRAMNQFFGNYADGGTVNGENQNPFMKEFIMNGFEKLRDGGIEFFKSVFRYDKKTEEQDKKTISEQTQKIFKDMGANSGAMGAGAIIGGGLSLVTGVAFGPLVGAAIGAGVGLVTKSETLQKVLFGEVDENGDRKGGILNKKISNFMTKQLPVMAKSGVLGAATGAMLGSPVLGAVIGAGVGFAKDSEWAKEKLFGAKDENGERKGSMLLPKDLQKKIKKAAPNISAGLIAGAVAGPFGSITANLVLGSALGYASSTEKFKEMLYGKETEEGKREGGIIGTLRTKLLGDNKDGGLKEWFEKGFFEPTRGIFQKIGRELIIHSKDAWKSITRKGRRALSGAWNSKAGQWIRRSKVGKAVGAVGKGAVGLAKLPFKAVSGGLKATDHFLENRALKRGYGLYNNEAKRDMTAAERNMLRAQRGYYGGKFTDIDEEIANMSDEELQEFQNQIQMYQDPTKKFDEDFKTYGDELGSEIDKLWKDGSVDPKMVHKLLKASKSGDSEKFNKILNKSNLSDEAKKNLTGRNQKILDTISGRAEALADSDKFRNKLVSNNSKLRKHVSDGMLDKVLELVGNDIDVRKMIKKEEDQKKEEQKNTPKGMHEEDVEQRNTIVDHLKNIKDMIAEKFGLVTDTIEKTSEDSTNELNKAITGSEDPNVREVFNPDGTVSKFKVKGGEYSPADNESKNEMKEITERAKTQHRAMELLAGGAAGGGLFSSIKDFLFGDENQKFSLKGIFKNLFSFAVTDVIPIALLGMGLSGKLDDIAHSLFPNFMGNRDDEATATADNGEKVTKSVDENGNEIWIDASGNKYGGNQISDINVRARDTSPFASRLAGNIARSTISGNGSVATLLLKNSKTAKAVGNGVKTVATKLSVGKNAINLINENVDDMTSNAVKLGIMDKVTSAVAKFTGALRKCPLIGPLADKIDEFTVFLTEKLIGKLEKVGIKEISKSSLKSAAMVIQAFLIIKDFTTGYEDARTTLRIKNPSEPQRILSGLIRAAKNCIPFIGTLIPDDFVVDIFYKFVAPLFGVDPSELKREQAEMQEEVDQWNATHGPDQQVDSVAQYNKDVLKDYTWTERIGNVTKSTWADVKNGAGKIVDGVKEKGLGGFITDSVKSMGSTFMDSYKENGGGLSGAFNAIGDTFQKMLPGIFGDIAKAKGEIRGFAAKGELSELWKVSLPDFSGGETVEGDITTAVPGIFSKIIGQIPLLTTKLTNTPFALVSMAFHKIGDMLGIDEKIASIKKTGQNIKDVYTETQDMIKGDGDLGSDLKSFFDFSKYTDNEGNPLGGVSRAIMFSTRLLSVTNLIIGRIGKGIKNFFVGAANKIKNGGSALLNNDKALYDTAKSGDFMGMWNQAAIGTDDKENPLAGIMSGVNVIQKISLTPFAAVSWAGHKIANFVGKITNGVKSGAMALLNNDKALYDTAKSGDFMGMWNQPIVESEDNPLSGIMDAVNVVQKVGLTPFAAASWAFHKVGDFVGKKVDAVKTDHKGLKDKETEMRNLTKQGKAQDIWNMDKLETSEDDPIGGIFKVINDIQRVFYGITATITGAIGGIGDFLTDPVGYIKDKATGKVKEGVEWAGDKINAGYQKFKSWISGGGSRFRRFKGGDSGIDSGFVSQLDNNYKDIPYSNSTIGEIGCAPAAATMLINQQRPGSMTMEQAIRAAQKYQATNGTSADYFGDILGQAGIGAEYIDGKGSGYQTLMNNLKAGKPTILLGQDPNNISKDNSPFGGNSHFVVAKYMDQSGNIVVDDPESSQPNKLYSSNILKNVSLGISTPSNMDGDPRKGSDMSGGAPTLDNEITRAVWGYFTSKGYSPAATAGIMANMQAESGIDPTRTQVGGPAAGIVQWESMKGNNGRWKQMADYAASKGKDWTDLQSQLDFVHAELSNDGTVPGIDPYTSNLFKKRFGSFDVFKTSEDLAATTKAFCDLFERPGKPHMEKRNEYAKQIFQLFNGSPYTGTFDSSVGAAGAVAGSDALTGTMGADGVTGASGETGEKLTIFNAMSKIASAFTDALSGTLTGKGNGATTGGPGASSAVMSAGLSSAGVEGFTPSPGGPGTSKQKALVEQLNSVAGKLAYSMSGARNPEQGSADCSSTVNWAYKKIFGKDIGNNTASILSSPETDVVDMATSGMDQTSGGKNSSGPNVENLEPGDLLLYSRPDSGYSGGRPYRVGHVEMYAGDGKRIGHGGPDPGPKVSDITRDAKRYIMAKRLKNVASYGAGSGLLNKLSKYYKGGDSGLETEEVVETPGLIANSTPLVTPPKLFGATEVAATTPTASNSGNGSVAQALQTIVKYVQTIASNTASIGAISSTLTNYVGAKTASDVAAVETAEAATATAAATTAANESNGSDTEENDKALEDLMGTLNLIATG